MKVKEFAEPFEDYVARSKKSYNKAREADPTLTYSDFTANDSKEDLDPETISFLAHALVNLVLFLADHLGNPALQKVAGTVGPLIRKFVEKCVQHVKEKGNFENINELLAFANKFLEEKIAWWKRDVITAGGSVLQKIVKKCVDYLHDALTGKGSFNEIVNSHFLRDGLSQCAEDDTEELEKEMIAKIDNDSELNKILS
mmetsp:Transcript_19729/g.28800  ORF Transcript_19729/g.28800 Transcript_19729/m.28800 type:complete len:199 (+) Transcript_19729:255-851(+)